MIAKKLEIINSCTTIVNAICDLAKQFPKTGKKRNIFIKTYNRRPLNEKKRNSPVYQIALTAYFGAIEIARIVATPMPKYEAGKHSIVTVGGANTEEIISLKNSLLEINKL